MQPFYEGKIASYKKAFDLQTIIRQIFMNIYKSMILMHPKKFIIQIKKHQ